MKTIAALVALSLALVATSRPADACGGYGSFPPGTGVAAAPAPVARETAVGVWPKLSHDRAGRLQLTLAYPKFAISGDHVYQDHFVVVRDERLRRLERALAASRELVVTVEEIKPGLWRVRSWTQTPDAGA